MHKLHLHVTTTMTSIKAGKRPLASHLKWSWVIMRMPASKMIEHSISLFDCRPHLPGSATKNVGGRVG